MIGESFLDHFTYNAWAGAGYYDLLNSSSVTRSNAIEKPVSPTDQNDGTGRFFLQQELSATFLPRPRENGSVCNVAAGGLYQRPERQ